jgi:hypothetical protein
MNNFQIDMAVKNIKKEMKNSQLMDYMVSLDFIDFISWGVLDNAPLYGITLWLSSAPPPSLCATAAALSFRLSLSVFSFVRNFH